MSPASGTAATVREGFTETVVASGLALPTAMAFAPDGRLFVCLQEGQLRVIKDGTLLQRPFLSVTVSAAGERGLLGVAVDPNFEINQYVYVYYTATTPTIHNRVSRFTANGDEAMPGSETIILELNPLSGATNHNGGALHFGPDGLLYVASGENANAANAQSLSNLLGKILRIDRNGGIPPTNPFGGQATGINRAIWAYGLRNPFTFAIEPATGRMLINDVGAGSWEEINDGFSGANYGWPATEGPTADPRFTGPLYAYPHGSGVCAISGGAFYPLGASQFPASFQGDYFFADFCAGWIRQLDLSTGIVAGDFASGIVSPVDLSVSSTGALYYLARGPGAATGLVARIDVIPGHEPAVSDLPVPVILTPGPDARYSAGGRITYAGAAFDPEDGRLPASRFTWEVTFHHGAQVLPAMAPRTGSTRGSFEVPARGETSPEVWYRIRLTVTDADGQQATAVRDVRPRTVQLTLASSPAGMTLTVDGVPLTAPFTFASVVGMRRTIGVEPSPSLNGVPYRFRRWADWRSSTRTIVTPDRARAFVAVFERAP
jgi:glucose/arabinose dehydrogenase